MLKKLADKNIRKILRNGGSYAVTLPIEMMNRLKWKEKQKVFLKLKGKSIIIRDWK